MCRVFFLQYVYARERKPCTRIKHGNSKLFALKVTSVAMARFHIPRNPNFLLRLPGGVRQAATTKT